MTIRKNPPGSKEAYDKGCLCSRMDNRYGEGMYVNRQGEVYYVTSDDCPLHGSGVESIFKRVADENQKGNEILR